jgi:hypothetical protein
MLHRVTLVITDVSVELSPFFFRVTRIGEVGTTLAVTRNRRTLRRNTKKYQPVNGDSFTFLSVDDVLTAQETPVDLHGLLTGIDLLFYIDVVCTLQKTAIGSHDLLRS